MSRVMQEGVTKVTPKLPKRLGHGRDRPEKIERKLCRAISPPIYAQASQLLAHLALLCRCAIVRVQVFGKKLNHGDGGLYSILGLAKTVTFVREKNVLDGNTPLLQVVDDLLCLNYRHIGVVRAVLDHDRCLDAIQLVNW